MRPGSPMRSEYHDRDHPVGAPLEPREQFVAARLQVVEAAAFGGTGDLGPPAQRPRADLERDLGVGHHVVEPARIDVAAAVGGEHYEAVSVGEVHHRVDPGLARACTDGVEQQQVQTVVDAADAALVRAELLDDLGVGLLPLRGVVGHQPGGHVNGRPPSTCTCAWNTVCPAPAPVFMTRRYPPSTSPSPSATAVASATSAAV